MRHMICKPTIHQYGSVTFSRSATRFWCSLVTFLLRIAVPFSGDTCITIRHLHHPHHHPHTALLSSILFEPNFSSRELWLYGLVAFVVSFVVPSFILHSTTVFVKPRPAAFYSNLHRVPAPPLHLTQPYSRKNFTKKSIFKPNKL